MTHPLAHRRETPARRDRRVRQALRPARSARVAVQAPGERADPRPSLATLRRWRKSVPPHFDFAVVAGPNLSRVKASEAAEQRARSGARRNRRAAGPLLRPAHAARRDADRPLARAHRQDRRTGSARRDPLRLGAERRLGDRGRRRPRRANGASCSRSTRRARPCPPGPVAYLRLRALGETRSFGPVALERIVQGGRAAARGLRHHRDRHGDRPRPSGCARSLAGGGRERRRGRDRLVRPRGGIVVRDDEQE